LRPVLCDFCGEDCTAENDRGSIKAASGRFTFPAMDIALHTETRITARKVDACVECAASLTAGIVKVLTEADRMEHDH
jgi:hypothetical protein